MFLCADPSAAGSIYVGLNIVRTRRYSLIVCPRASRGWIGPFMLPKEAKERVKKTEGKDGRFLKLSPLDLPMTLRLFLDLQSILNVTS